LADLLAVADTTSVSLDVAVRFRNALELARVVALPLSSSSFALRPWYAAVMPSYRTCLASSRTVDRRSMLIRSSMILSVSRPEMSPLIEATPPIVSPPLQEAVNSKQ